MNIQEEIFKSIENLTKKNSSSTLMDFPTVIIGTVGDDKYKVKINGIERTVKNGIGLELQLGNAVWVHAMNGDFKELYIISRR